MATTLVVEPQIVNLQVGQTQVCNITTNATDGYKFVIDQEGIVNFDQDSKTITAVAEGEANITITAKNGADAAVSAVIACKIVQLTTTLVVRPVISTLKIGEKQILRIETDADGYTWESSKPNIVSIDKSTNTILGVASGSSVLTFRATRTNYKEKVVTMGITVQEEQGVPVKIKFYNARTGKTTTIQTSNNDDSKDVTYKLPETSGTLLTEEELDSSIKVIEQPKITQPLNGAVNVEANIEATEFKSILGFQGSHSRTEWQFATDSDFTNIVLEKEAISTYGHKMTSTSPSLANSTVYVRVKYWSGENSSLWSDPVQFTTKLVGPAGPQEVLTGSCITAAYFGEVPFDECIADRDYFGNWETLKTIAANYQFLTNTDGRGDWLVNAPKGSQVHYKDKLYYAKEYLRSQDGKFLVTPGTDEEKWVEDNRENLHTPKKFVFEVGIGYNARPNKLGGNLQMDNATYWHRDPYPHADKPTTLPNYIYPWGMSGKTYNTVPDAYDIPTCSWLKFGYKGKILYIPKVPLLASIAWNDLAKVHAVYGDRTMRIGSRLYWYRLMKEDEYRKLLVGLTDGSLGNMDSKELDIDKNTADTSKNIFREGLVHWIEDFREGGYRKVISGGKDNVVVEDKSPRLACGVYRPVLELIPEGDEPYNNLPDAPTCYDENFRYDKYTDTGYFGRIKAVDFIDGVTLASNVGYTAGTNQLSNYDWLKFYYHGAIVFLPMATLKYNVDWIGKNNANILYGCDLGGRGRTDVKIGRFVFSVEETHNVHSTPRWNDNTMQDHHYLSEGGSYRAYGCQGRVNLHSMVQDLYVRVTGTKIKGRDFMYSTDELDESGVWCGGTYKDGYGSHQIGDNWEEFPLTSLCVRYCDGFSGTAWHGKYLYSYIYQSSGWKDNLSNTTYSPYPFYSGLGSVIGSHVPTSSDATWGWRPALHLRS